MAFQQVNEQTKISGFFISKVGAVCEGTLVKRVETAKGGAKGAYYLVTLTADCTVQSVDPKDKKKQINVKAKAGETIGVSECATLKDLTKYLGKLVRLTFTGTVPSKNFAGKDVKLFKIEVDDGVPF
jgi:hypothetical protein